MGGTSFSIDDQLGNRVAASGQIFKDDTNDFLHLFKVSFPNSYTLTGG
jgi:hypothetical protein